MPRLAGKAAIVTGGSRGIGAAICKALAREGAAVAVTDVLDDEGHAIAEHINSTGGQARFWHLDVTDEAAVEHVLGEVAHAFGKIDVVVNNAGIVGVRKPTHETTIEEWEHVLNINVHGRLPVHKARRTAFAPRRGRLHHQSLVNLRHYQHAECPTLPRVQGSGAGHDQNRRVALCPG